MFFSADQRLPCALGTHCYACSDLSRCKISCLDYDAFAFEGAHLVTTVNIQSNDLLELPEELLWNMTALQIFKATDLPKLAS